MEIRKFIRRIVHNPFIDLIMGVILMLFGFLEAFDTLPQDLANLNFGGHHAVILLGFVTMLRSLVDVFAGIDLLDQSIEIHNKQK